MNCTQFNSNTKQYSLTCLVKTAYSTRNDKRVAHYCPRAYVYYYEGRSLSYVTDCRFKSRKRTFEHQHISICKFSVSYYKCNISI